MRMNSLMSATVCRGVSSERKRPGPSGDVCGMNWERERPLLKKAPSSTSTCTGKRVGRWPAAGRGGAWFGSNRTHGAVHAYFSMLRRPASVVGGARWGRGG